MFQLADTLLVCRQRIPDAALTTLLGIILFDPATNRGLADVHALTDLIGCQPLFLDHANNFKLLADLELSALLFSDLPSGGGVSHRSRCLYKLDHYRMTQQILTRISISVLFRILKCTNATVLHRLPNWRCNRVCDMKSRIQSSTFIYIDLY
jgi:hypothetical protein